MTGDYRDSVAVRDLVERLYAAFDEPNDLLTAPHFSPEREGIVAAAVRYDRRTIPNAVMDDLAWCLATTIGGPTTLRHYLPRIVEEELLLDGLNSMEWWIVAGKLREADVETWPDRGRRLVLPAVKLWIGHDILRDTAATVADFPELTPESILARTPVEALLGMLDPHRGTAEPWWGSLKDREAETAFLLELERSAAEC